MRRILLMCGAAFSGKTTLSKAIAERRGFVRISIDEINDERGLPPGGEGLPVEEWERSSMEAVRRMRHAMQEGRDVVLDDTCCFRFLRDRYRKVAGEFGYTATIVYLEVPPEELHRRLAANRMTPRRPDFRDRLFVQHIGEFEPPADDEATLVFRWGDRIREWIELNFMSQPAFLG